MEKSIEGKKSSDIFLGALNMVKGGFEWLPNPNLQMTPKEQFESNKERGLFKDFKLVGEWK